MEVDDIKDIQPLVDELEVSIDELEKALTPILDGDYAEITSTLPLLDKAKMNTLMAYAIESLVFSSLKLSGVDAREHAVYKELERVKGYFEKIKKAEEASLGKNQSKKMTLDTEAAGRMIKHGLAGNKTPDNKQNGGQDSEKQKADAPNQAQGEDTTTQGDHQTKQRKKPRRNKKPNNDQTPPNDADNKQTRNRHRKAKSNKPPRSGKAVFQDLLNKAPANSKSTGSGNG